MAATMGRRPAARWLFVALALLCQACVRAPPPGPLDSVVFDKRAPLAGQPGWAETIRFINDGVRYLEPRGAFVVSPQGNLCFRGALEITFQRLANYRTFWCMPASAVAAVEALDDDITHVPLVRLWCRHDAPYCAFRVDGFPWYGSYGAADMIAVQTIPYRREKAAIEYLVYLMGGAAKPAVSSGLDSGPVLSSVPPPSGKWEKP